MPELGQRISQTHIDNLIVLSTVGPKLVPIQQIVTFADIGINGSNLIMRPINKAHTKRIAKSNGKWPDIECVHIQWNNEDRFLLIDGRHRLEAAKMLGMQNVRITTRLYKSAEDVVEHAMTSNLHHGLIVQRKKLADYIIWLYEDGYDIGQIANIVELGEKEVSRIISKYESEDDDGMVYVKSDGQLLLDYLTRLHKRTGDKAADISHEMVEAMNDAPERKQDDYIASIQFLSDVLRRIKIT